MKKRHLSWVWWGVFGMLIISAAALLLFRSARGPRAAPTPQSALRASPVPVTRDAVGTADLPTRLVETQAVENTAVGSTAATATEPTAEAPVSTANPAAAYCAEQGGVLEIREDEGEQAGTCIFGDGSRCEAQALLQGACAPGGAYAPLDPAACENVATAVAETFTLDVTTGPAAFEDYVDGRHGSGCQATAEGDGYDFGSLTEASAILGVMLAVRGWEEDPRYRIDGETEMASAYRLGDGLCLAHIGWEPAEEAGCTADQPLATCELAPDQQWYRATLSCARYGLGADQPPPGLSDKD